MADNTILEAVVTPGDTIATDEIAGAKHQRCKVSLGSDGSATDWPLGQQLMAASAPVVLSSDHSTIGVKDTVAQASLSAIATQVALIASYTDTLEALIAATNALLTTIDGHVDGLEAQVLLIQGYVDGIEGLLTSIHADVDGVEGQLTTLIGHVDGVEGLIAATNALLTTIDADTSIIAAWNEAGRAATNIISGQIGVQAGAGATSANTIRVVEATDSPGVVSLALLDDVVKTDDAAFTPATDKVAMVGATFDDVAPDSVNEGDAGALRMSANRNLYTTIRDAAGNERGLNVDANGEVGIGAIRTSVTPGTAAANLGKAEDQAHVSGDVGVMALGVANEANAARAADGDYLPPALDTEGNVRCVGNRDHDAVDAGEVLKVGSRVQDYEPDADATESGGLAEVAEGDRANLSLNRRGELIEGVNTERISLSTLNTTYDDSPTTVTSSSVECWNYRWATFSLTIDSTNTPTDLQIDIEVSQDGTNFAKLMNGPLGLWKYDDVATATAISRALSFPICAYKIRVTITCTGTTASNTFAVTNAMLFLRN